MISDLQIHILFFINKKIGANKQLYVPSVMILNAYKRANYNERIISAALTALTNTGYLEYRERNYRITESGFIFIEAYSISRGIREEMQAELKRSVVYQWLAIVAAFVAILIVVLQK